MILDGCSLLELSATDYLLWVISLLPSSLLRELALFLFWLTTDAFLLESLPIGWDGSDYLCAAEEAILEVAKD